MTVPLNRQEINFIVSDKGCKDNWFYDGTQARISSFTFSSCPGCVFVIYRKVISIYFF
jgi:hypothetical protein